MAGTRNYKQNGIRDGPGSREQKSVDESLQITTADPRWIHATLASSRAARLKSSERLGRFIILVAVGGVLGGVSSSLFGQSQNASTATTRNANTQVSVADLAQPPSVAAQRDAMTQIREVFGTQIDAAKQPTEKLDLSWKLLQAGIDEHQDKAAKYTLLCLSLENACAGGSFEVALSAIDELSKSYVIDRLTLTSNAARKVSSVITQSLDRLNLANALNSVVETAVQQDRYGLAAQAADLASANARSSGDSLSIFITGSQLHRVQEIQAAYPAFKAATQTLSHNAADIEANQKVGEFRCLQKRDWRGGLPLLALGGNSTMAKLARKELSASDAANDQLAIADEWWSLSENATGNSKAAMQLHAAAYYQRTFAVMDKGLLRDKAAHRVELATAAENPLPSAAAVGVDLKGTTAVTLSGDQKEDSVVLPPRSKPYELEGQYRVPKGKTLEIQAGAVVICDMRSELNVQGTLIVTGTEAHPVEFHGSRRLYGWWKGMCLDGASDPKVEYAQFFDAENGASIYNNTPSFSSCIFANNTVGINIGRYSSEKHGAILQDCVFCFNKTHGIVMHGSSATITSCTITKNGVCGITGAYYVDITLDKSIVSLNTGDGISVGTYDCHITADGCVLGGNGGLDINNNADPQWDLRGNYWGPGETEALKQHGTDRLPHSKGKLRCENFLEQMPEECGAKIKQFNGVKLW